MCPDPNLCKTLVKCYNERKTDDTIEIGTSNIPANVSNAAMAAVVEGGNSSSINSVNINVHSSTTSASQSKSHSSVMSSINSSSSGTGPLDECLLCSDQKRDTQFRVSNI